MAHNKHRRKQNQPAKRKPEVQTRPRGGDDSGGVSWWRWEGAIAHPDDMEAYKRVDANLPMEIVGMAKDQASHRKRIESAILVDTPRRSMWMAFALAIILIGAGTFLVTQGHVVIGSAAMMTAIATMLVSLFKIIGQPSGAIAQPESD